MEAMNDDMIQVKGAGRPVMAEIMNDDMIQVKEAVLSGGDHG